MKITDQINRLKEIQNLKKQNNFKDTNIAVLRSLPSFNGICEFSFKNNTFFMLNIDRDDATTLKIIWRGGYEQATLNLWYSLTRPLNCSYLDIGAHTGIFNIIGNLGKQTNQIYSYEPFLKNYCRIIDNLKLNNLDIKKIFLEAISNTHSIKSFSLNNSNTNYHHAGGKIIDNGETKVQCNYIDNLNINSKVKVIKIDTEGHEHEVLKGGKNLIKDQCPDIIFEINQESFLQSTQMLLEYNYNFYLIDEKDNNCIRVKDLNEIPKNISNCFATKKDIGELYKII